MIDHADFWDNAPAGHLVLTTDGQIVDVNATLVGWLGRPAQALRGTSFAELLTVGGRIHYETHFVPLLRMTGSLKGVTVDLPNAAGAACQNSLSESSPEKCSIP